MKFWVIRYRTLLNRSNGWLLLVLGLAGACIDQIDLEGTGGGKGQLVIQGQLVKGSPSSIRVRVSRTADFAIRSFPTAVSGAVVFLMDQNGNQLPVPEVEPGIYQTQIVPDNEPLSIETGQNYFLSVNTEEGSQYQSSAERLAPVPLADSVSIQTIEREELDFTNISVATQYMQFFIHTPLETVTSPDRAFLRWTFETVYRVDEVLVPGPGPGPATCFVSRGLNLDRVVVFNGNETNSNRLERFFIVEDEVDFTFALGYLLRVKQHSLSRDAYEYWNKVSQAVALSGGLFEASPGEIVGNIFNVNDPGETVYGYFYASEEQKLTRFVTPDESGRPEDFCSLDQFSGEIECIRCEAIPFSTKEVPDDWEQ